MTCVSADGRILPNFIIFEKCLPKLSSDCGWPKDWMYTSSPNGKEYTNKSTAQLCTHHLHYCYWKRIWLHLHLKSAFQRNLSGSHLRGWGLVPGASSSGKAGSCLPLVGSLQYKTLTNYVLVSSALTTTRHDMTCTVLKVT